MAIGDSYHKNIELPISVGYIKNITHNCPQSLPAAFKKLILPDTCNIFNVKSN